MANKGFKPVDPKQDFVEMEKKLLKYWYEEGIVEKYLNKNNNSTKKFSFLDGPITANNPMGVHHAWGRTYKDLWQRFYNMQGYAGRFQNGFDEQGLWVEVEVEKELGFKNKKDIEKYGIDKFVQKCKERVAKFSAIQTEQSKRLGYFMDWENSYHTSSDENNYAIWNFLKVCHQKGYLYKGRDSVPWCPRCGTAISQHEILTEEYKELTHTSVYVKFRVKSNSKEWSNTSVLAWTTTPWTLPSNVALAVDSDINYVCVPDPDTKDHWLVLGYESFKNLLKKSYFPSNYKNLSKKEIDIFKGKEMVGLNYEGPFDYLPIVKKQLGTYKHRIVATDSMILPISTDEGTSTVHIATGAGAEDFALGKKEKLPVVASINEEAIYEKGFDFLTGLNTNDAAPKIIANLEKSHFVFKSEQYTHRYPTCWRCKTELVWRVVDEWYIAMDKKDPDDKKGRTLRNEMKDVAKKIKWLPEFGLARELDWLDNMHDWLISKKRYWGLTLPIWECAKCRNFDVIGSKEELKEKAQEGWDKFEGNSPHRPWVDEVKIKCSSCNSISSRIPDVGNPWLDAGIVSVSTMSSDWFPADFITESFPGQFKNWFYSLIAMSTVLKNTNPAKTILGFATLLDEKGEEMHKSKGNAIEFNEAADKIGVDVMRWMYALQNPSSNLLFGYHKADEVRRRFYLILWNVYSFFVTYANLDNWLPKDRIGQDSKNILDKWIISEQTLLVDTAVNNSLNKYESSKASEAIEYFVIKNLSGWYIRRSRDRIGISSVNNEDKVSFYSTLYTVLETLARLLAPFMPFVSDEIYRNLTGKESVHLAQYPSVKINIFNKELHEQMVAARGITENVHAARKDLGIKVRQPLAELTYGSAKLPREIEQLIADEVNVKKLTFKKGAKLSLDTKISPELKAEGEAREVIRQIQVARKDAGLSLKDRITVTLTDWPKSHEEVIKKATLANEIKKGEVLEIEKV